MVPVCLLNPTDKLINLYSVLEVVDVMDSHSVEHSVVENTVIISEVCDDKECSLLEEMLLELVKDTSLAGQHQDLLLTLPIDYLDILLGPR